MKTNYYLGLFLVTLVTLMVELDLTRIFDVIAGTNLAYMIITCALFALGLAGVYATLFAKQLQKAGSSLLPWLALGLGGFIVLIVPVVNSLPNLGHLWGSLRAQVFYYGIAYLAILIPFFLAGLIVTILIARYPRKIRPLYFWDLLGAALGCLLVLPLLPLVGAGGVLMIAAALALIAAALFSERRAALPVCAPIALVVAVLPPLLPPGTLGLFDSSVPKFTRTQKASETVEVTYWDPISKIDVLDKPATGDSSAGKDVRYDGDRQSSEFVPFDGDYESLRENPRLLSQSFWTLDVFASHFLKRDTGHTVFDIGSAAGNEIRAALLFGASHIDAVDLVATVLRLGKTTYADYTGGIFNDPRANVRAAEGRSFLRASKRKYDVIQIYSNHTTSSIASGGAALNTNYLYTVEAFQEYFSHLTPDGVLQINMLVYPRLITTAAAAWRKEGRSDFQKHVVVYEQGTGDWQPGVFIKNTPWTRAELADLRTVFHEYPDRHRAMTGPYRLSADPLDPAQADLPIKWFSEELSERDLEQIDYRVAPATDDRPYFTFVRKSFRRVSADSSRFMPPAVAAMLNRQLLSSWLSMDVFHLVVTGAAGVFYAIVFLFVPLRFSTVGREPWSGKWGVLGYFACLGAGFIIFELTLIQIFMHFIGFPLYVYSTVIFSMLLGAGVGSLTSDRLGITVDGRWLWPFLSIVAIAALHAFLAPQIFQLFLGLPTWLRVAAAAVLILPFGFVLGVPFPLGILLLERHAKAAIPWAWAMNGLFTVVGGLASVLLSLFYGFRRTFVVAMAIYLLAAGLFWLMKGRMRTQSAAWPGEPAS